MTQLEIGSFLYNRTLRAQQDVRAGVRPIEEAVRGHQRKQYVVTRGSSTWSLEKQYVVNYMLRFIIGGRSINDK